MNRVALNTQGKGILTNLIILILPLVLVGCHTMEGVGTDVKEAGKSLERSAERHKPNSPSCTCCGR
ncbi:MAG: entericidin [Alphaproteobacteria bacterium]|nr:entericidin [Alphaproteobacteria bacterium]